MFARMRADALEDDETDDDALEGLSVTARAVVETVTEAIAEM